MAISTPPSSMPILFLFPILASLPFILAGGACSPKGNLLGKFGHCKPKDGPNCCTNGQIYPLYTCSPPTTSATHATMTLRLFTRPLFGGRNPAQCDRRFHARQDAVVALSTGWYNAGKRCGRSIKISGNGRTVVAKVVDECDSSYGCDHVHGFQRPCGNNVVEASPAVWKAFGIHGKKIKEFPITWSDV